LIPTFSKPSHRLGRHSFLFAAVFTSWFFLASIRAAQQSASPQTPLESSTQVVKIDVSVLDQKGEFVSALTGHDFRVLDSGVEQPIVFFAPVEAPAQVLVMLEVSPAVYLIQNEHIAAAYALLDGLAPDDQVALVTYDVTPHGVLGFTADKSALLASLSGVQYTIGMGDLNLYDSISAVLDWLSSSTGKKALVLLSTGLDSSPPSNWDALVRKVRSKDVVIFPVALGGSLRAAPNRKAKSKKKPSDADTTQETDAPRVDSSRTFAQADAALLSLASITGGRAFFPQSANDFVPTYRQIASALRHEYVLGIAPAQDGLFHSLTVEVTDNAGGFADPHAKRPPYRIFARAGYLAPKP
jgi:Ca-activated chloride channel homolog